jgi:hypothetical protein
VTAGTLIGGWDSVWTLLVLIGWARPVLDLIFCAHMVKPVCVVKPFDPAAAGCAHLGSRVRVSPAFAEKVYDIVSPGTTIVVTDAPALRPSPAAHAIFLMEAAKR